MMRKVFVECRRRGELIATYDFGFPATLAAPPEMPNQEQLVDQAKDNLTNESRAFPPYDDIEFRIRSD